MITAMVLVKFGADPKRVARYGDSVIKSIPSNIKVKQSYWTFGRYDAVWIVESTDEKALFEWFLKVGRQDIAKTETLVSIPRNQALDIIQRKGQGFSKTKKTKSKNSRASKRRSAHSDSIRRLVQSQKKPSPSSTKERKSKKNPTLTKKRR